MRRRGSSSSEGGHRVGWRRDGWGGKRVGRKGSRGGEGGSQEGGRGRGWEWEVMSW